MSGRMILRGVVSCAAAVLIVLPLVAEARGGFSGARGARMGMGGGGMHAPAGGHMGGGGFNAPHGNGPRMAGPGMHQPPHQNHGGGNPPPNNHPSGHQPPPPGGGGHHNGPPPPPPPPGPHWPGYWNGSGAWWTAAAVLAIGTLVTSLPPDGCEDVQISGTTFKNCNGTWLKPVYNGHSVSYQVVNNPQ